MSTDNMRPGLKSPSELKKSVIRCFRSGNVPYTRSGVGVGKTEIHEQIAIENSMDYIPQMLSLMNPTDLNGFGSVVNGRTVFNPQKSIPIVGDPVPPNGALVFLDEFSTAPMAVQVAAFRMVNERYIGEHKVHERVFFALAGNNEEDGPFVEELLTPMKTRLTHYQLKATIHDWTAWAIQNNVYPKTIAWLNAQPEFLTNYDPKLDSFTFACPRTHVNASKMIMANSKTSIEDLFDDVAGTIGTGAAIAFMDYIAFYTQLPTFAEIAANPTTTMLPTEKNLQYAIICELGSKTTTAELTNVLKYCERMPVEFSTLAVRMITTKQPKSVSHPAIINWITAHGNKFYN